MLNSKVAEGENNSNSDKNGMAMAKIADIIWDCLFEVRL